MTGTRLLIVVLGFWILMRAVNKDASGRTLVDRLVGNKASQSPVLQMAAGGVGGGAGVLGGVAQGITQFGRSGPFTANPIPGASGGRLDQGEDPTTKTWEAPFDGTVVVSNQSDPGWDGGGYVAIRSAADPSKVVYEAEGIAPLVQVGQQVRAGQVVGKPVSNPYNGVVGNGEIGFANPNSPGQPLAQVVSNPRQMVLQFYNWLRGIGGPAATQTSHAGYG